jgi:excisionase family DNA binding protein
MKVNDEPPRWSNVEQQRIPIVAGVNVCARVRHFFISGSKRLMPSQTTTSADVDIDAAAIELNVSTKFIRRRIADRTLPAYRIKGSRLIRIRRADLEALKLPVGGAV